MPIKKSELEERLSLDAFIKEEVKTPVQEESDTRPFVFLDPNSSYSESFKILRTNLKFTMKLTEPRCLMVTSSLTAEGKTTIVANLAASFAQSGAKVAVVGTDMRIPSLYKQFGVEQEMGLSNYLNHEVELKDIVREYKEEPRLHIIPSGSLPPNSADLLSSDRFLEFVAVLKQKYDLAIFDSPPVNLVSDSIIMGPIMDGVLVVVNKGQSRRKDLKMCLERLRFSNVIGFVVNASTEKAERSSYYYNRNYGYGYGYGHKNQYGSRYYTYGKTPHTASSDAVEPIEANNK
ncbi:MAG: CpsD/CapB family tyrosine-protein kinase [Caldisericia bacterium]|nr:CpsD/CapB family tyrosine-protein kinase [Caldisericia bacterium]